MFNKPLKKKNELLSKENLKLREIIKKRDNLEYILGEEDLLRDKEVDGMLRTFILNEATWKFARKAYIQIAMDSMAIQNEKEIFKRNEYVKGFMIWLDKAQKLEYKDSDRKKIDKFKKKYLPQI